MKNKFLFSIAAFIVLTSVSSCKKFLNVEPLDALSGNLFWKTKSDVETFTGGIYNSMRTATMINRVFFPSTGDFRGAPLVTSSAYNPSSTSGLRFPNYLRTNSLVTGLSLTSAVDQSFITKNTVWSDFYSIIQSSNILYEQLGKLASGILTETEANRYRAEAVFMRCFTYFLLVRLYGDVSYYTKAFNSDPLPRTNMVTVLKNCIADLDAVKDYLPWTQEDENSVAVRASKGSIYVLMMHMNMWAAGFDDANKATYYQSVANLGKDMMDNQGGAYELLPLVRSNEIFHGRSKEGLFEIVQNINAGEQFKTTAQYADYVLIQPYKPYTVPKITYDLTFMLKVYPITDADNRKTQWFDANLYTGNGLQQMTKFALSVQQSATDPGSNDNQIVFRYADVILLRAEAEAELGQDGDAATHLNIVRARAGANPSSATGQNLKDVIYYERVREFMGEGQYYYDLVRTRKLIDGTYAFNPISADAFRQGAWTWPIDASALTNNPFMVLNNYWR